MVENCITCFKYLSSSTQLFQYIFSTMDALSPLLQSSLKHHFVLHEYTHKKKKLRPPFFLTEVSKNYYNFQNFLSDKIICHKSNQAKKPQHQERERASKTKSSQRGKEMFLRRKEKSMHSCPCEIQTSSVFRHWRDFTQNFSFLRLPNY